MDVDYASPPTEHEWHDDHVRIICAGDSLNRFGHVRFDFRAMGLSRDSYACSVIDSLPCPFDFSRTYVVSYIRVIRALSKNESAFKFVRLPWDKLSSVGAYQLLEAVDDAIDKMGHEDKRGSFRIATKLFNEADIYTSDGIPFSHIVYESRHAYKDKKKKVLLSDSYDGSLNEDWLRQPINALFEESENKDENLLAHLEARIAKIRSACDRVYAAYKEVKTWVKDEKEKALSENLKIIRNLSLTLKYKDFRYVWGALSEADKTAILFSRSNNEQWHASTINGVYRRIDSLSSLPKEWPPLANDGFVFLALCEHFVPGHVVDAIAISLLTKYGLNQQTIKTISADNIIRRGSKMELTGLKGRTDQLQSVTTSSGHKLSLRYPFRQDVDSLPIDDALLVEQLELLIKNREIAQQFCTVVGDGIFISPCLRKNRVVFRTIRLEATRCVNRLVDMTGVQNFNFRILRNQVAAAYFIKSGRDIHATAAFMFHASASTTYSYIFSEIEFRTNEANLKTYMDILAKSIKFSLGRGPAPVSHAPLFPVSRFWAEDDESIVDRWLASQGEISIVIGRNEVEQCVLQRRYYLLSYLDLLQGSAIRFVRFEFPRIIVCYALYRIISASPLGSYLRKFEETLDA
ncbi:hypothetical protein AWB71_02792 [Caballeronia peredens]|nr:hypothetical protein AWB71_02792 [Caballeronia peredens]